MMSPNGRRRLATVILLLLLSEPSPSTAEAAHTIGEEDDVANQGTKHHHYHHHHPLPLLVDLFEGGVSRYPWSYDTMVCYRIPSLLRTKRGTLLAVASERLAPKVGPWGFCSDDSAVNVVSRRSTDGGRSWEGMRLIVPSGGATGGFSGWTVQDDKTGRIFLFFNTVTNTNSKSKCDCRVSFVTSNDDGITWSKQHDIDPHHGQRYQPFLGSGLTSGITVRSSGRMVGCMRKICANACGPPYHSKAFYSDDHGSTWHMSPNLHNGTTECQIAELSDGTLYMTTRPYQGWNETHNVRLKSYSFDDGTTWTEPQPEMSLIDYGFADEGSIVSDPDGKILYFVHNDAKDRSNLAVYRSTHDERDWDPTDARIVYRGSSSYTDAAVLDPIGEGGTGGEVGVMFERDGYGRISFARVSFDDGVNGNSGLEVSS